MRLSASQPYQRRAGALKVLLIIFVVLAVICAGVGTYVYLNFRSLMVDALLPPIKQLIADSHLPQAQKDRITVVLERISQDYRDGKIDYGQMAGIMGQLTQGPFALLTQVEVVRGEYHAKVQTAEDQTAAVDVVFDRYERGIVEDLIPPDQAEKALGLVSKVGDNKQQVLDKDVTPERLKAFFERISQEVDKAAVPNEPHQVDFAAYLEDAVSGTLGESPSARPAEKPPATTTTP